MAGSDIPDRHADSALTYEPAAGQRIYLLPNTELILRNPPVQRNFKEPLWFTHCCLTRASLYPQITETKTMFSNGRNTQALRLQQFTRTISVSKQSNGNPLQTKCKARRGGLNPTNAVSRINVAILGVFLDSVYQRLRSSTDHAIQKTCGGKAGVLLHER